MTVSQAISWIIKEFGINILKSPERVQAMVMDSVSENDQDKRLFCIICQNDILTLATKMVSLEDPAKIRELAIMAKSRLEYNNRMKEEYAIHSINMLLRGLGLSYQLDFEHTIKKELELHRETGGNTILNEHCNLKEDSEKRDKIENVFLEELDNADSLLKLGDNYCFGVKRDLITAKCYYEKVKEKGNRKQKKQADRMLKYISWERQEE